MRRLHRTGRRIRAVPAVVAVLAVLALCLAPEGRLTCGQPSLEDASPDQGWRLTVCRRPMMFAMPGGASDAPGWIVLRDPEAAIRGVVHLDMMQLLGEAHGDPVWESGQVVLPGLATIPLVPASGPVARWIEDRFWRLRALTGMVPADEMSAQWSAKGW